MIIKYIPLQQGLRLVCALILFTYINIRVIGLLLLTQFSKQYYLHHIYNSYLCNIRIKENIKGKGITLSQLADTMGVSRQALSRQVVGNYL